jgi:hypothetical protein
MDWIVSARASFSPGPRKDCEVCGKFADIAHAHHVYPLWAQCRNKRVHPIHRFVWLCPNHHAAIHFIMSQENKVRGNSRLIDLTIEEEEAIWILIDEYHELKNLDEDAIFDRTAAE